MMETSTCPSDRSLKKSTFTPSTHSSSECVEVEAEVDSLEEDVEEATIGSSAPLPCDGDSNQSSSSSLGKGTQRANVISSSSSSGISPTKLTSKPTLLT